MIKRCEVLITGEKPITYSLDRDVIYIGSGGVCHIRINHPSISRKHLRFTKEDGKCFVSDEGSTNGTEFGKKRLSKDQKIEIQDQDSLSLGNQVLLTFLGEDESVDSTRPFAMHDPEENSFEYEENIDRTTIISSNNTNKLLQERAKIQKEKHRKKPKSNNSFPSMVILILALIAFAIFGWPEYENILDPGVESDRKTHSSTIVPETELVKKATFEAYKEYPKCENPKEKYICDIIPNNLGAVQISNMLNIFIDAKLYFQQAEAELKEYQGESSPADIKKVAAIKFLHDIPKGFDSTNLSNMNFTFAFYKAESEIDFLLSVKGVHLEELRAKINIDQFSDLKKIGPVVFLYADDYMTIY